jgi:lysophospholipase L1-like esterase
MQSRGKGLHFRLLRQLSLVLFLVLFLGSSALVFASLVVDLPPVLLLAKSALLGAGMTIFFILDWVIDLERINEVFEVFKNIVLVATTVITLAWSGEFTVRLVLADITTTSDAGSYFARRWREKAVRTNTLSFREREFPITKPAQTYRVAVIGDSFTYGQGIEEAERFTNLLESSLNKKSFQRRYEVLNFGKPGAQTADEIVTLKDVVLKVQPDFILLQWFINDVEGPEQKFKYDVLPLIPSRSLAEFFHTSSGLYFLMENGWYTLQANLGMTSSYPEFLRERFQDANSSSSKAYVTMLRRFIQLARGNDIPLAIVLFPYLVSDLDHEYPFAFLHNLVLDVCAMEHVPCIDLRSTFAPYTRPENPNRLQVNRFDAHPNALANNLATKRIHDELEPIVTIEPLRGG